MFIYKITVDDKAYIGFDTKETYKQHRWKEHCRQANSGSKYKIHKAMADYGIENCVFEVLEDGFDKIGKLALAEIAYISKFNTYKNGLNSTPGGDGYSRFLGDLSENEILQIKTVLGENFSNYNKTIKWAGTSEDDRKSLTAHLHTEEIYLKKSESLKEYYESHPEERKNKGIAIKKYNQENKELITKRNKINGQLGADKVSKKIKVKMPDNTVKIFKSKSEFHRETNQWAQTVISNTLKGKSWNGFKAWEI